MKELCLECCEEKEVTLKETERMTTLIGRDVKYNAKYYVCNDCGKEVPSNDLFDENLMNAFNTYKEEMGMLSKEEIKEIRNNLNFSEAEMADVLGCSEQTIKKYEKGAIPLVEHDEIYKKVVALNRTKNDVKLGVTQLKVLLSN